MGIYLRYPDKIENNNLCDGLFHKIEPKEIEKLNLNGNLFYRLTYYDKKFNCYAETILIKKGTRFYKIPLRSYPNFNDPRFKLEKENLSILDNIDIILLFVVKE